MDVMLVIPYSTLKGYRGVNASCEMHLMAYTHMGPDEHVVDTHVTSEDVTQTCVDHVKLVVDVRDSWPDIRTEVYAGFERRSCRGHPVANHWPSATTRVVKEALDHHMDCDGPRFYIWQDVKLLNMYLKRMVGEWMMDPIKIPWFRRLGSSWSLVYLVRGGSRPNLTEGSLSAAIGFDAIGEHTGVGHNRNIVMSFGGESPGSEGPES
ncbi:hypothetical protein M5K25_012833 [Dendrobium thyrsiflorum]|uniref:Uncharacterized protein n=1 Tax=Dendrobium thyrsiflorum TaxID=117978 RepID=A0ABD0UY50_DENTH